MDEQITAPDEGSNPLSEFSSWVIERWKADRRKQASASTVNRELTTLKALFRQAIEWDMLPKNPTRGVKYLPVSNQRLRYLAAHEIPALLEACRAEGERAPWLYPLVSLALNTGLRQGELLALRWEAIDLQVGLLTVVASKNNEQRRVPLNQAAREALDALPRCGAWLFAWPWGKQPAKSTVHLAFRRACARARIVGFKFHDGRHTFASHLVMKGVDLRTVQELLGHKTLEMTLRYSHLAPEHKQKAVDKLNDLTCAPNLLSATDPGAELDRNGNHLEVRVAAGDAQVAAKAGSSEMEAGGIEPPKTGNSGHSRDKKSATYVPTLSRDCPSYPAFWAPGAHDLLYPAFVPESAREIPRP